MKLQLERKTTVYVLGKLWISKEWYLVRIRCSKGLNDLVLPPGAVAVVIPVIPVRSRRKK